jgi:hypothetical protein
MNAFTRAKNTVSGAVYGQNEASQTDRTAVQSGTGTDLDRASATDTTAGTRMNTQHGVTGSGYSDVGGVMGTGHDTRHTLGPNHDAPGRMTGTGSNVSGGMTGTGHNHGGISNAASNATNVSPVGSQPGVTGTGIAPHHGVGTTGYTGEHDMSSPASNRHFGASETVSGVVPSGKVGFADKAKNAVSGVTGHKPQHAATGTGYNAPHGGITSEHNVQQNMPGTGHHGVTGTGTGAYPSAAETYPGAPPAGNVGFVEKAKNAVSGVTGNKQQHAPTGAGYNNSHGGTTSEHNVLPTVPGTGHHGVTGTDTGAYHSATGTHVNAQQANKVGTVEKAKNAVHDVTNKLKGHH